MGIMLSKIIATVLTLFAGIGTAKVIDKVAADKFPVVKEYLPVEQPMKKLFGLAVFTVIGVILLRYILRKTGLSRQIKL